MNTPGVNANAVKELVLCCLLLSSRPIIEASRMVQTLTGPNILEQAENKRNFCTYRAKTKKANGFALQLSSHISTSFVFCLF